MTDFFFKPDANYAVIILDFVEKESRSDGGIIVINDKQTQRAQANATILAVGDGCEWKERINVGDRVTIAQHAGQPFYNDDELTADERKVAERVRIVVDDDILGVLNPEFSMKQWCAEQLKTKEDAA